MIWTELQRLVADNDSFLISSHLSLDGDCVGSQLAMRWYLGSLGKQAVVYNRDPVPGKFRFLRGWEAITSERPRRDFDVLMILDCSNPSRLGWEPREMSVRRMVNIDHHRDNTSFADVNIVDRSVAATAQLIHGFFAAAGVDYPATVAEALYAGILTDTGGFRFSNTTGEVLRICADLAERGAECAKIYEASFDSHSTNGLMLWSRIWSTLRFHFDGRVCTMELPLALVEQLGAAYSDSEGVADCTILAKGVDVGIFIKYDDRETHFSLRSRGRVDVGRIAQQVRGGGGHSCAAGCTMQLPLEQARERMFHILREAL